MTTDIIKEPSQLDKTSEIIRSTLGLKTTMPPKPDSKGKGVQKGLFEHSQAR